MANSILGGINQEATQQELLGGAVYLLNAILEKLPRVTGTDQAAVSIESGSVGLTAGQTLATLTTLSNMLAIGGNFVAGHNVNLAGTQHIYGNIIVS